LFAQTRPIAFRLEIIVEGWLAADYVANNVWDAHLMVKRDICISTQQLFATS